MPNAQEAGYNPELDTQKLYKAMKGFGTDEKTLIDILCSKDPVQMHILREHYNRKHRDLIQHIKSEVSGNFEEGLVAICMGPLDQDCKVLHDAVSGPGTDEEMLNDVLLGRSNADLKAIKARYQATYYSRPGHNGSLALDVGNDLSGNTKRLFDIVLEASRMEESAPIDSKEVEKDTTDLYRATEGKNGTDVMLVCDIMARRSNAHIGAIAYTYEKRFKKTLEHVIKKVRLHDFVYVSATDVV